MTTQEAYEMMRIYLTREGALRAVDTDGDCMYETYIGGEVHRCAVGCLLTPSTLAQTVESEFDEEPMVFRNISATVDDLEELGFVTPELDDVNTGFLREAQRLHDEDVNWNTGKFCVAMLDELARHHGLKVVVDEPRGAPKPVFTLA